VATTQRFTRGMNGGNKKKFIQENKEFILKYLSMFGEDDCTERFQVDRLTLEGLMDSHYQLLDPLTELEKSILMSKMAMESVRQLRFEVSKLKKEFEGFQGSVSEQLTEKFFKPLLQNVLKAPRRSANSWDRVPGLELLTVAAKESPAEDPLYAEALKLRMDRQQITPGILQQRLRISRERAARLSGQLEEDPRINLSKIPS